MEKKKYLDLAVKIISYVLVAALASTVTFFLVDEDNKLTELEQLLKNRFVGQADPVAMEDAAAAAMVGALGDRWSYYIPAAAYESYRANKTNTYVGIGITVETREDGQGLDIKRVEPDSGAYEAGVLPGDILIEAQGQPLTGGVDPGQYIRGEEGTQVAIAVLREGQRLEFQVTRRKLQTQVAKGQMLPGNIAYIKIVNFNDHSAEQTIAYVEELMAQGAEGIIFDVRDNPGGYRTELVKILDDLLPEGPLFRSVSSLGIETTDESDENCVNLPMVVLVNGESYSAAEFFAAALSEYDWATVVGMPTCGKGYYQQTFRLSDGSAVGLSVGAYYTPKGVNLAETGGLVPDVEVPVDENTAAQIYAGLVAPMDDPQVLAALELLP